MTLRDLDSLTATGGMPRAATLLPLAPSRWRWIALLLGLLALGCGTHDKTPALGGSGGSEGSGGAEGSAGSGDGSECSGDFDVYEPGMSRQAEPGDVTVELVESVPAPPVVRSDNTWWLKLTDSAGQPILGAQLLVTPFMPKHQHGSAEVVIEELGDGRYKLSPIDLIMPGVWEIPLSISPPDSETSEMTFRFCIAEL